MAEPGCALDRHSAALQCGDIAIDRADRDFEFAGECRRRNRARGRSQILDHVEDYAKLRCEDVSTTMAVLLRSIKSPRLHSATVPPPLALSPRPWR